LIYNSRAARDKHEKNNQTLSNDWPTYCHMGIPVLYNKYNDYRIRQVCTETLMMYMYYIFL